MPLRVGRLNLLGEVRSVLRFDSAYSVPNAPFLRHLKNRVSDYVYDYDYFDLTFCDEAFGFGAACGLRLAPNPGKSGRGMVAAMKG